MSSKRNMYPNNLQNNQMMHTSVLYKNDEY